MTESDHQKNNETTVGMANDVNAKVICHTNVDQNIIIITEDKMELILRDYLKNIGDRQSWATPLGIFISLILILVTVEKYKSALNISVETWRTIIYVAIALSGTWLIYAIYKVIKNRPISIKDIIKSMKNSRQ